MDIELLRKVKQRILDEPKRFNLELWGASVKPADLAKLIDFDEEVMPEEFVLAQQKPPCGAVGCIAGNTCIISGSVKPQFLGDLEIYTFPVDTMDRATADLGIDIDSASRLFYLTSWGHSDVHGAPIGWPESFEERLAITTPGTIEYAQVAADRIEHFIATNGAE